MVAIKYYTDREEACALIRKFHSENHENNLVVKGWYNDIGITAYTLEEDDGQIVSIALLSQCTFDPKKLQARPHVLNHIYTVRNQRRKGYATKLLKHIQESTEFSAFCCDLMVIRFFEQNGCKNYGIYNNTILLRYPA